MTQERSSWQIKDAAILDELIALLGLEAAECTLLREVQPAAQAVAPTLSDTFYARLEGHAHTNEYLHGVDTARLHRTLSGWFVELFSGTYDYAYVNKRLAIGYAHVRIGLPVRYPLAMIEVIYPFGEQVARQSSQPDKTVHAFRKILALDVAIFNQAYENNQLEHLSHLVGGERLARLLLIGNGL